jgi:hypothetical protein
LPHDLSNFFLTTRHPDWLSVVSSLSIRTEVGINAGKRILNQKEAMRDRINYFFDILQLLADRRFARPGRLCALSWRGAMRRLDGPKPDAGIGEADAVRRDKPIPSIWAVCVAALRRIWNQMRQSRAVEDSLEALLAPVHPEPDC